jgi:hypothetical protein
VVGLDLQGVHQRHQVVTFIAGNIVEILQKSGLDIVIVDLIFLSTGERESAFG